METAHGKSVQALRLTNSAMAGEENNAVKSGKTDLGQNVLGKMGVITKLDVVITKLDSVISFSGQFLWTLAFLYWCY